MKSIEFLWFRLCAMSLLFVGLRRQALEVFDHMVALYPGQRYPLASRAHLHAQAGRHQAALDDYRVLLESDPGDAVGWFNSGFVLETLERWDEALHAFSRATTLNPKLDAAWYGLGLVLIRLQRFDEAIAALKRNTELQPMSPYGWYQLARVHIDAKDPEQARQIIRHLKGFEPKVAAQLERETGLQVGQT